jgi:hypothetical protein
MRHILSLAGGFVFASMFWNILWSTYQTAKAAGGKYGKRRKLMIISRVIAMFFVGLFLTSELTAALEE